MIGLTRAMDQGGFRPAVIASPTASDPAFAESLEKDIAESDFTVVFNGSTFDLRLPIAAVDAEPRGK